MDAPQQFNLHKYNVYIWKHGCWGLILTIRSCANITSSLEMWMWIIFVIIRQLKINIRMGEIWPTNILKINQISVMSNLATDISFSSVRFSECNRISLPVLWLVTAGKALSVWPDLAVPEGHYLVLCLHSLESLPSFSTGCRPLNSYMIKCNLWIIKVFIMTKVIMNGFMISS